MLDVRFDQGQSWTLSRLSPAALDAHKEGTVYRRRHGTEGGRPRCWARDGPLPPAHWPTLIARSQPVGRAGCPFEGLANGTAQPD